MQSIIRQTIFQAQPLKNVVGVGNTTAYSIVVSQGRNLGTFGCISVPAQAEVLNDSRYSRNAAPEPGIKQIISRFRSALATLQS